MQEERRKDKKFRPLEVRGKLISLKKTPLQKKVIRGSGGSKMWMVNLIQNIVVSILCTY